MKVCVFVSEQEVLTGFFHSIGECTYVLMVAPKYRRQNLVKTVTWRRTRRAQCFLLPVSFVTQPRLGLRDNVHTVWKGGEREKTKKGGMKRRGGACGWDFFSVWPLLPLLKRKLAGVMSVHVSNVSEWQEVVCHWSSLPISPRGPSSPPPHQLLHQTQGQAHEHTRTHTPTTTPLLLYLITFPFTPSRRTPPDPRPPWTPSLPNFSPTLLHLCAPAPALSFPCPSQEPAWQCVMNGTTLLLSSVGLV